MDHRFFLRLTVVLGLLLYIVFAIKSVGYHHLDEHYQIIQFAEYKLGNTNEISWEFHSKIRSSLQPLICMSVFSGLRTIGITDHFTLALSLRLLTAFLAVTAITIFISDTVENIPVNFRVLYIILSYFLWFLPYLEVRFSSETWSGLFCLLAVSKAQKLSYTRNMQNLFLVGLFSGLAVLFRFQSVVFILGLFGWVYFISGLSIKKTAITLTTTLVVLLLGIVMDSFFYKSFTVTIYNYVNINLFKGVATYFGTEPWYMVFGYIIKGAFYPIGITILVCCMLFFVARPRSIYAWTIIPFLLLHVLSPHKELRFLFPLVNFIPIVVINALIIYNSSGLSIRRTNAQIGIVIILIMNMIGILVVYYKGTRRGETEIAQYIHTAFPGKKVNLLTSPENNPFDPRMELREHFYKDASTKITDINSVWEPNLKTLIREDEINLLILSADENTGPQTALRLKQLKLSRLTEKRTLFNNLFLDLYDEELAGQSLALYKFN